MKIGKKIMSLLLAMIMCFTIIPIMDLGIKVYAKSYITNSSSANGGNYASSSSLASKLNTVFSGDIDIYSNSGCTNEVSMPLGKNMSNSTQYYVKSKTTGNNVSGWQCYIYANAVYNKLFNEWVGHGTSFSHSKVVISGGSNTVSYSMFSNAGVKCGAYMRTTTYSNGAYNGSDGHSLIILSYDSSNISYLEGNGDGNGLIRIAKMTWSEFNSGQLSGRSRYISHIVQPKDSYYDSLYKVDITSTVSFNANGGTCSTSSKTVTYGSTYGTLPTPTRTGYTFADWYTSASGGTKITSSSTVSITSAQTLYAHWTANAYSVIFNANGGSCSASGKTVTYGSAYGTLTTPTRTGYTFNGWYTAASGGAQITSSSTVSITSNQTLYAQWIPNVLYVYYNAMGASINSNKFKLKDNLLYFIGDDSKVEEIWNYDNIPLYGLTDYTTFGLSKPGYKFVGWGTSAAGGTIFDQDTYYLPADINPNIKNDDCSITLYAIWIPNTLYVHYNAMGASINSNKFKLKDNLLYFISDDSKVREIWSYDNIPLYGLTDYTTFGLSKPGYKFVGWGTTADGGTVFDQDTYYLPTEINPNIKNGDCSMTLYAIWEEIVLTSVSDAVVDTENNLIFGVDEGLTNIKDYVSLSADGAEIEFTPTANGNGTGSTVTIKADGKEIASYKVVIFGDVNGDGIADAEDAMRFGAFANYENFDYYEYNEIFKAADLNCDGVVDAMDETEMNSVANYEAYIDQKADGGYRIVRY